jgi:uncharacterized membrane protein YciS (DUF1049 family)
MVAITAGYAVLWVICFGLLYRMIGKQRELTAQVLQLEQDINEQADT